MTEQELHREVARLESINDQLSAELGHIDQLMRLLGFSEGLNTIKVTAQEIIEKGYDLEEMEFEEGEEEAC